MLKLRLVIQCSEGVRRVRFLLGVMMVNPRSERVRRVSLTLGVCLVIVSFITIH